MNGSMNTNDDGLVTCSRCMGQGTLPHLRHVDDGMCYGCDGTGRAEPKAARPAPEYLPRDMRNTLRNFYRAASRKNDPRGPMTYEDLMDPVYSGWTAKGLSDALDMVPGSREAFRALGWPV